MQGKAWLLSTRLATSPSPINISSRTYFRKIALQTTESSIQNYKPEDCMGCVEISTPTAKDFDAFCVLIGPLLLLKPLCIFWLFEKLMLVKLGLRLNSNKILESLKFRKKR